MKANKLFIENAKLFSKFDEMHQQMLKRLEDISSVWFMNILMKTLLQHKCKDTRGEGLSEEDLKLLTHADLTIVLEYLLLNVIPLMDPRAEDVLRDRQEDWRQLEGDEQVNALLLVLYNLQEMDWKEFRHHSPVIFDGEYSQEALN